jgi:2',3'-cyclic-nucleotide 2'-phosphodiesterase (5'-nucleotidase family)
MKNKQLRLLWAVFLLICMSSYSLAGDGKVKVILLHTNDMHSKIDNMAKLAWLADSLRRENPYVFLLSAGDNFTGNPVVDMIPDKGYPMIDLMNHCRFDVSAVGNHEFDLGQPTMNKRFAEARFPFISCNIDATGAMLRQMSPFIVLEAGKDATIAVVSAIQLNSSGIPDSHPSNLEGIRFSDGLVKTQEYRWLKQKYGILVGLTHLGVEDDIRLADSMPEFDVILGGHSHTLIRVPIIENGVMIGQAGAHLRFIGKTTLTIENGRVSDREYEIIEASSLTGENKKVRSLINKYNTNETFDRVVGMTESPLTGCDELGSLMADAVTDQLGTDIAFQNKGGIRIHSIPAGNITLKTIYQLDPFGNQVVVIKMNVEEIRSLICAGYNLEKEIDLQVSGITYTLTVDSLHQCDRVVLRDLTGKPLDPAREYTVGLSSYVAVTYKFEHRDPGKTLYTTTSQALIGYLEKVKTIHYSGVKRALVTD